MASTTGVEGLAWPDAFLNAAMLLGEWVRSIRYAQRLQMVGRNLRLFAGVVFLVLAGVMLAPVIHHVLQRFRLEKGIR